MRITPNSAGFLPPLMKRSRIMRSRLCLPVRQALLPLLFVGLTGGCIHANRHSAYRSIHQDATNGDVARTLDDIRQDPSVLNLPNDTGRTPLHLAAANCRIDEVKLLLDKGAVIESKSRDLATPLHLAAQEGCKDVVDLLLTKGAELNPRDKDQRTPLDRAERYKQAAIVQLLLQKGGRE